MSTHQALYNPNDAHARWFVGLELKGDGAQLNAALVVAHGQGCAAEVQLAAALDERLSDELALRLHTILRGGAAAPAQAAAAASQLAEVQADCVGNLLAAARVPLSAIWALGVHDPGLWHAEESSPLGYTALCDAARLAERTGLNVIDAFPARDLAQGGLGGPILAIAQWVCLRDRYRTRALIDLGRTLRLVFLPPGGPDMANRVLAFDVGPGASLLDLLVEKLTDGAQSIDPGGHIAVQGRQISELMQHWLSDPVFDRPLPRWYPHGVRPERFIDDSLRLALQADRSGRDVLCTANHFLAESIARAIARRLPTLPQLDDLLVTGGAQQNGMLLRALGERCAGRNILRVADLGMPCHALGPSAAAVLALLHVDQTPANSTAITGVATPRVLGRLTPGAPQHWQRLLRALAGARPTLGLRSAV